jgi:hypothetical protein
MKINQNIAEVIVPGSASGKVSATGQESYVRWIREKKPDGILLLGQLARGNRLDPIEREELFSSWRAALAPQQKLLVAIPFGGTAETQIEVIHQAINAREMGADGVVIYEKYAVAEITARHNVLELLAWKLEESTHNMVETARSLNSALEADLRINRAFGFSKATLKRLSPLFESKPFHFWPQFLLWALQCENVLKASEAHDFLLSETSQQEIAHLRTHIVTP